MSVRTHYLYTLLIVVFVVLNLSAYAQTHQVSGYIRDASTGESLIGATVYDTKQKKGTVANNFGFYSITASGDSVTLKYSFVGYASKTVSLRINRDTSLLVLLQSGRTLDEVIIEGNRPEKIHESTRTGTVNLPVAQIKSIPAFAGEQDVLKALQLLPGVSGGNEGSSNILVRGGTPDQTLILMDGVPIYNPTHLYGLVSSFNPDAVNNVELVKGGFPARYGGRLSGIADITLREGNSNKFSAAATVGLLASRILLEGPIIKNKTSFLISGRASYLTLMRTALTPKVGKASLDNYKFHDINAKVNHRINSKNRLYASMYTGQDMMSAAYATTARDSISPLQIFNRTNSFGEGIQWSNFLGSVRWNHEISPKVFFNATAYMSNYELKITSDIIRTSQSEITSDTARQYSNYNYTSRIRDAGIKVDFDHTPNNTHYLRYGATAIQHRFIPGVGAKMSSTPSFAVSPVDVPVTTNELNAYIEDDVSLTSKLKVNAGVHGVLYNVSGKSYTGVQPRLSFRYALDNSLSLKASYSYMQQYLQTLTNAGIGMPVELWVPSTDRVKPQFSHQVSIGAAQTREKDIEVSAELFYKTMGNLIEYSEGATYLNNNDPWYEKIETGRGRAYGLELFVQKKTGRLTGFAGYTLSWNERQFDNINKGRWYYYRFDRRHDFKATANYKLNEKFDLSATWIFATGNAVTVPVGQYAVRGSGYAWYNYIFQEGASSTSVREYQSRSNYRMPPYHRLDVSVSYAVVKGQFEHKATVGFYNTYNRPNPFYLQYSGDRFRLISVSLFPILPAASYSIKF